MQPTQLPQRLRVAIAAKAYVLAVDAYIGAKPVLKRAGYKVCCISFLPRCVASITAILDLSNSLHLWRVSHSPQKTSMHLYQGTLRRVAAEVETQIKELTALLKEQVRASIASRMVSGLHVSSEYLPACVQEHTHQQGHLLVYITGHGAESQCSGVHWPHQTAWRSCGRPAGEISFDDLFTRHLLSSDSLACCDGSGIGAQINRTLALWPMCSYLLPRW